VRTEIILLPQAVEVDPELLVGIEPHARVVLAVEPIESAAHDRVELTVRDLLDHPLRVLQQDGHIGPSPHATRQTGSGVPHKPQQIDVSRPLCLEQEMFAWLVARTACATRGM
jgi:hypothetical protein